MGAMCTDGNSDNDSRLPTENDVPYFDKTSLPPQLLPTDMLDTYHRLTEAKRTYNEEEVANLLNVTVSTDVEIEE